jgi:hypothetical protein
MARKFVWEVDEATTVEAKLGAFGKLVVTINGLARGIRRSRKESVVSLPDGRTAVVKVTTRFASPSLVELWLGGATLVPTPKGGLFCPACKHKLHGYDRFCTACGAQVPSAEDYQHRDQVKNATNAIKGLGILYLLVGIAMYFVARNQASTVLAKLDNMDPAATLPQSINGIAYTVAQLRDRLLWEPRGLLFANLILAGCMGGLAIWSRRAPLGAAIVAATIFAAVNVFNAIVDPTTIAQGLFVKIVFVALLARGIHSALALRAANG